ncbi:MAG: D-alanyl-D-alanine carboxypeptidase family protein [Armatimonadota bacterium]
MRSAVALVAVLLIASGGASGASRKRADPKPVTPAASIVMDVKTGAVLSASEIHRRWPPASTTKILSAILVIERLPLDRLVPISERAAAQRNGSAIGLEVGEQWLVSDLLSAMMVRSANDAAVALAEAAAGSVERFAEEMNARAVRLGARNTHFTNPHGLHDPKHFTTAYDLALITRYALRHPTFARLASTQVWVLARADRPQQEYVNSNKFLGRYIGANGVKTGWTAASGPCLVASATRGKWQLLSVVLNSASSQHMYRDSEGLLEHAFQSFHLLRVAQQGESMAMVTLGRPNAQVPAIVPADVHAVVKNGAKVTSRVMVRTDLRPPIEAGERVGDVVFLNGHTVVARSVLIAARTVRR